MINDWSDDIEKVLDQIRINCVILSKQHKKRYFYLNYILQYFRLPVIIISGINSIISVGLQPYLNQGTISMMTCLLALACSIIGSIELYLAIQKSMENELLASKDFYILSIDLHKTLTLSRLHRPIPAKEYLEKKYSEYVKMFENSNLLSKKIIDSLNPLPQPQLNLIQNISSKYQPRSISDEEESSSNYNISQSPSGLDEESMIHPQMQSQQIQEISEKASTSLLSNLVSQKQQASEKVSLLSKNAQQNGQEMVEKVSHSLLPSNKIQEAPAMMINKAQEFLSYEYDRESLLPLKINGKEIEKIGKPLFEIPSSSPSPLNSPSTPVSLSAIENEERNTH